jgi:hypothetical protein
MFNYPIPKALVLTGIISLVPCVAEANNIAEYYPPGRGTCYIITNERQSYDLTRVRTGVYGVPPVCDFSTYKAPVPASATNAPSSSPDSMMPNPANPAPQNQVAPAPAPAPPPPPPAASAPPTPSAFQRVRGVAPASSSAGQ